MRKKNILVLTGWSFKDALVQAYTLPYVYIMAKKIPPGSKIFLVTFEQEHIALTKEEKKKAKTELSAKGIHLVTFNYSRFGLIAVIKWLWSMKYLWWLAVLRNVSYIHAWCTPAGSLGYLISIFTGKPLIIDSYEPHAEAMVENKTWAAHGMKYRIQFYFEKKLSKRAKYIISATEGMKDYAVRKYGVTLNNFYVKPACVDLELFNPAKRKNPKLLNELNLRDKIVCVYAGKFGGIYLTHEVFRFFHFAEKKWGDKFRALLLTNYDSQQLYKWSEQNGFSQDKLVVRFVPHKDIPEYMGLGDFGITPVKPIPTKRYCTPIKDGEYWALGLPVVITKDISDDSEIILKNDAGVVIEELNDEGYAKAIETLSKKLNAYNPSDISAVAQKYRNFSIADKIYEEIYGR
jgi:glycosyltransferase involved in cell wall biosynthesis